MSNGLLSSEVPAVPSALQATPGPRPPRPMSYPYMMKIPAASFGVRRLRLLSVLVRVPRTASAAETTSWLQTRHRLLNVLSTDHEVLRLRPIYSLLTFYLFFSILPLTLSYLDLSLLQQGDSSPTYHHHHYA